MHRALLASAFVGLAALAGCASTGTEAVEDDGPTALVEIQNRNWIAMEIYASARGQRVRLGRLAAGRERTYTLPGRLFAGGPTQVVFEMEADGSEREVLREAISVAPGETVIVVIPNTR